MSKVIFKLKFQSPNFKNTKMNNMYHLLYIGTREGVALNDDIKELEIPKGSTNGEYVKYISDRPRSHGLFTKDNINVDINEISKIMKEYNGYVYRGIVSLKEQDAIEKGYDEKELWEDLIRDKMLFISKQLNIPYSKLDWVGAFHRESGHPHIHLMLWNKEEEVRNIGIIPKGNIEAIRKELTREIFDNEYENVLSLKNVYRDFLTDTTKGINKENHSKSFIGLDEKLEEINLKYEIKKMQERITLLTKEINGLGSDEAKQSKRIEKEGLEVRLEEGLKKIDVYEKKTALQGLNSEKEIINKERELKKLQELVQINKYDEYIYQSKFRLGVFKEQRDRKILSNRRDIIELKCNLVDLINKQKALEIKECFKEMDINIDSLDDDLLDINQLNQKEEYMKLKKSTEHIKEVGTELLGEKIATLTKEFELNKWKLNDEDKICNLEGDLEFINKDFVTTKITELNESITKCTENITRLKGEVLNEVEGLEEYIVQGSESITLFDLEKEIKAIKKESGIDSIESELKKLNKANKSNIKNEKILELEGKIKELNDMLKESSYIEGQHIKTRIYEIKNEIDIEKENEINKEVEKLGIELQIAKEEIGVFDKEFNEFKLEDRVRSVDISEIGDMINELIVPKGGRLQYKLMPQEVKMEIDKITDRIVKIPQYKRMFEGYVKSVEELTKLYTERVEDIDEAKLNAKEDIYTRIGNNILKCKKEIVANNRNTNFVVQRLLSNVAKMFGTNTEHNKKRKSVADKSKSQKRELAKKMKARGLYEDEEA